MILRAGIADSMPLPVSQHRIQSVSQARSPLGRFGALPRPSSGAGYRHLIHQIDEEGRLMALTGRQDGPKREALPVSGQVNQR